MKYKSRLFIVLILLLVFFISNNFLLPLEEAEAAAVALIGPSLELARNIAGLIVAGSVIYAGHEFAKFNITESLYTRLSSAYKNLTNLQKNAFDSLSNSLSNTATSLDVTTQQLINAGLNTFASYLSTSLTYDKPVPEVYFPTPSGEIIYKDFENKEFTIPSNFQEINENALNVIKEANFVDSLGYPVEVSINYYTRAHSFNYSYSSNYYNWDDYKIDPNLIKVLRVYYDITMTNLYTSTSRKFNVVKNIIDHPTDGLREFLSTNFTISNKTLTNKNQFEEITDNIDYSNLANLLGSYKMDCIKEVFQTTDALGPLEKLISNGTLAIGSGTLVHSPPYIYTNAITLTGDVVIPRLPDYELELDKVNNREVAVPLPTLDYNLPLKNALETDFQLPDSIEIEYGSTQNPPVSDFSSIINAILSIPEMIIDGIKSLFPEIPPEIIMLFPNLLALLIAILGLFGKALVFLGELNNIPSSSSMLNDGMLSGINFVKSINYGGVSLYGLILGIVNIMFALLVFRLVKRILTGVGEATGPNIFFN